MPVTRTAAEVLVDQLVAQGVTHVFCVPGESYLAVLDALHDRPIEVIVCRQEAGCAIMAEAVGKATGRPGVCFVTRAPGATNAMHGIHIAQQGSSPMIMFVGQIERGARGREAFQEIDYRAVFGPVAKHADEIDEAARIPEIVSRAFHVAMNGRPGPVVLALPEDMLSERVAVADAPRVVPIETAPLPADMDRLAALLAAAQAPVLILGGSRWTPESCAAVTRFAERWDLPVVTSFRRLPLFDPLHPNNAGDLGIGSNPKLLARIAASDLVIVLGGRLGDIPSQGYSLFDIPTPKTKLVHIHPEPAELGRVYAPTLAICATPIGLAGALDALAPAAAPAWAGSAEAAHADYRAWSDVATPQPGGVNLGEIMVWLRENLPAQAILTSGAGNFAAWIARFYRVRRFAGHAAPLSGSMGYGVPAAVAMQLLEPQTPVVCLTGDGDFLMNGQEFATAVQYDLPIVILVADNGQYGTIRMHQEREYPTRISGTQLRNPDFAAYARAFGGFGATVDRTEDFADTYAPSRAAGKPAILHLRIDPEAILPGATLSAIREAALERARRAAATPSG
ncbi:Acetolactate synthase, large subunit [Beijerinckiaceae bacterium RH AL1]|nr:Acetolactate synthase, large subunit [Beijerinckiaceae bacterium RH CH11]VVB48090.1 Acetolactate synthase, large subunit [Beijerinckiaceae bacterium RH AL8]VVC56178.1 Acetolactate synthase, large subunit [Beijerinckiaceae bacterium RH AL1]